MRVCAALVLALGMAVPFSGRASAHHSFAGMFDNAVAVNLSGVVTSVEMVNPHSFIYLDVTTDGAVERWALEGPGPTQVYRRGFDAAFIKPGDRLAVCGYLARADVSPTTREPATGKPARTLSAAVLMTADRGRFAWSNYRQGKCGLDQ